MFSFLVEKCHQTSYHRYLMLMIYLCYPVVAFSSVHGFVKHSTVISTTTEHMDIHRRASVKSNSYPFHLQIRGGGEQDIVEENEVQPLQGKDTATTLFSLSYVVSALKFFGASYSHSVTARPILTKSATAMVTFGLSDWTAQCIESSSSSQQSSPPSKQNKMNWKRLLFSAGVGLFYFGPAAHYWYEAIFALLPGTSLSSSIVKAIFGQLIFGPLFYLCVFCVVTSTRQCIHFPTMVHKNSKRFARCMAGRFGILANCGFS